MNAMPKPAKTTRRRSPAAPTPSTSESGPRRPAEDDSMASRARECLSTPTTGRSGNAVNDTGSPRSGFHTIRPDVGMNPRRHCQPVLVHPQHFRGQRRHVGWPIAEDHLARAVCQHLLRRCTLRQLTDPNGHGRPPLTKVRHDACDRTFETMWPRSRCRAGHEARRPYRSRRRTRPRCCESSASPGPTNARPAAVSTKPRPTR